MEIYEFSSYIEYLVYLFESSHFGGRGFKSKIAKVIGSNTSYISHVFSGRQNLTEEQAFLIADFINLSAEKTEYFLLLVQMERSGSESLKAFKLKQINQMQQENKELSTRYKDQLKAISNDVKEIYFSSWHYAAVHVLTALEGYDNKDSISKRLGLSYEVVQQSLDFLVDSQLVTFSSKDGYHFVAGNLHIEKSSVFSKLHNQNWRRKAANSIDFHSEADFHYSSIIGYSARDSSKIRDMLVKAVDEIRKEVSKPATSTEDIYCYNIDFFKL